MTSYRYLGYGVTDSNGVAHLDHDPSGNPINGYTGTGIGEVDVIASTDNPITGSSIVSEPSIIMDYINYDNGIEGDSSNIWTGATTSLTRTPTGSVFSSTTIQKITTTALIKGDFEATFQAYGSGSPLWGVEDTNSNRTRFWLRNDADFTYYKITRSDGVITAKYSFDGNTWSNLTVQSSEVTSADCYFLFHNNSGTKSITFKNLKIYPI